MYRNVLGVAAVVIVFTACGGEAEEVPLVEEPMPTDEAPAQVEGVGLQAQARFINDQGTEIGTAALTQEADGVHIEYDLAFLHGGEHGFHIHEVGSCEPPAFASAGDHLNPTNASHGFDHPQGPHAGDLRNIDVYPDDGTASGTQTNNLVTLAAGQPNSLLDADGSAIVIHQAPDDYQTQPSGDSGDPIACAVIEPA